MWGRGDGRRGQLSSVISFTLGVVLPEKLLCVNMKPATLDFGDNTL